MQELSDPKLSDQERAQLTQRMVEMQEKMMAAQQASIAKMSDPKYIQQQQQEQAQFDCKNMNFSANADPVEGQLSCGQNVGTLKIKGTRRFVGP